MGEEPPFEPPAFLSCLVIAAVGVCASCLGPVAMALWISLSSMFE